MARCAVSVVLVGMHQPITQCVSIVLMVMAVTLGHLWLVVSVKCLHRQAVVSCVAVASTRQPITPCASSVRSAMRVMKVSKLPVVLANGLMVLSVLSALRELWASPTVLSVCHVPSVKLVSVA